MPIRAIRVYERYMMTVGEVAGRIKMNGSWYKRKELMKR